MNQINLVGNIGADAELIDFGNGGKILKFSIATTESWKNKETQEYESRTTWHLIQSRAVGLQQYLVKGQRVAITGTQRHDQYEKDGQIRYSSYVRADKVNILWDKKHNNTTSDAPF